MLLVRLGLAAIAIGLCACAPLKQHQIPVGPAQAVGTLDEAALEVAIKQRREHSVADEDIRAVQTSILGRFQGWRAAKLTLACLKDDRVEVTDGTIAVRRGFQPDFPFIVRGGLITPDVNKELADLLAEFEGRFRALELAYAMFQDSRRLHSAVEHDNTLLRLTVVHGLLVLEHALELRELRAGLESFGCSLHFLDDAFKRVDVIKDDVATGQLPVLLKRLETQQDPAESAAFRIQAGALVGDDVSQACAELDGTKEERRTDTVVFAWCGYGAYRKGDASTAERYFTRASASVFDAEAASYSQRMRQWVKEHPKPELLRVVK